MPEAGQQIVLGDFMFRFLPIFLIGVLIVAIVLPPIVNAVVGTGALPEAAASAARSITTDPIETNLSDIAGAPVPGGGFPFPMLSAILGVMLVVGVMTGGGIFLFRRSPETAMMGARAMLLATLSSAVGTVVSPMVSRIMCPIAPGLYCPAEPTGE